MRRSYAYAAALTLLVAAACSETSSPTLPAVVPFQSGVGNVTTLEAYIQGQIDALLPAGFEDAVDARWSTVQRKKNGGDMAGAVLQLNQLTSWILKKQGDITPPSGETKLQAATRLIVNMSKWLYEGADAPVSLVEGADVAVQLVPAGTSATVVTPTLHAGVSFGPQTEDRIIAIYQEEYPGTCVGPLDTQRCQYPLFYKIESFPKKRLVSPGHFAVCLVTNGDRAPLDRPSDIIEGDGPVHTRMRLAHNKPASSADYTPGSTIEGNIEILPLAESQIGFTNCSQPSTIGMSMPRKVLHYAVELASKVLSPKSAYAYDSGPEHLSDFFSNFNGVDPLSAPDLGVEGLTVPATANPGNSVTVSYSVVNRSRVNGGDATAASNGTTVRAWLSTDNVVDGSDTPLGSVAVPPMMPDAPALPISHTFTAPAAGDYNVIVQIDPSPGVPEVSLTNNTASGAIDVTDPVPNPQLAYRYSEQYSTEAGDWDRYRLTVTNRGDYPASMFAPAPALPPCGTNTSSSRSWVDIFDGTTNNYIYGFCGLSSPAGLHEIWFAMPRWVQPPASVYIKITDRATNTVYTSNTINLYGPLFINYPRAVDVNWSAVAGAAAYQVQWDYCESWASPDWRTCNIAWTTGGSLTTTSLFATFTFVGDQPGRWRVNAKDAEGATISSTPYKFFNYFTGSPLP